MPKISVLMSVYNSAPYLRQAVDSILNQTFPDFEFVIIDDGSTDETAAILESYPDPRLVRLKNPQNIGLTHSLNRGLEALRGEYIARMDADDISVPERFERQLAFLESYPEVGLVGSNMASIDAAGNPLYGGRSEFTGGAADGYLRWALHWMNPIPHVTIFARRELLQQNRYDPAYNTVEEFELWTRLIQQTKFARMPDVFIQRRIVETSVTRTRRAEQIALHGQLVARELRRLLGKPVPAHAINTMVRLIGNESPDPQHFPAAADALVESYHAVQHHLTPDEKDQVQYQIISYLMQMSTMGKTLYPLWKMRQVSMKYFLSRDTFYLARKAVL